MFIAKRGTSALTHDRKQFSCLKVQEKINWQFPPNAWFDSSRTPQCQRLPSMRLRASGAASLSVAPLQRKLAAVKMNPSRHFDDKA
ncbi:MAG: hypothetical protein LBS59_04835 [Puniceicoccales bacterium]|jgi:hypothetical protein|nr:hypothetical protein [Puniceicoccales bacterium]